MPRLILAAYNLALMAALLLGAPYWAVQISRQSKYREGLRERLGAVPGRLRSCVAGSARTVWVHAVSVGEVLAVSRLIAELDARAPGFRVVISTTTRTGQRLARERFGSERCFYFPLDLPWAVARYRRALKPALLLLAESEFWPNLLWQCRRSGIPVVVVNARISDRSLPRYQRLRRFWRPFLAALSLVLAQSREDARRFALIGVAPPRVQVGGNLKFDVRVAGSATIVEAVRRALPAGAQAVVCGSTLEGEETVLLESWRRVRAAAPNVVMIVAPRHPERFARVGELLAASGMPWKRRSQWIDHADVLEPGSILLLDSLGELAALYSLASLAFVGGSLVAAGGHNPLEPAQFGVPVLMGPHYENFREMVEMLRGAGALEIVNDESLAITMAELLEDRGRAEELGKRGRAIFAGNAGATERAVKAVLEVLSAPGERA